MKTRTIVSKISAGLLIFIISATSCKKSDTTTNVTADDAADAVTYSMQTSTGGYAGQVTDAAAYSSSQGVNKTGGTQSLSCGVQFDTSVTKSYTGTFTATYTHDWKYLLNCTGIAPTSINFTGTYSGSFDGTRMQSQQQRYTEFSYHRLGQQLHRLYYQWQFQPHWLTHIEG